MTSNNWRRHSAAYWLLSALRILFLLLFFIFTVFPFFWMISTAVKGSQAEVYAFPVIFWPDNPTLSNFANILVKGNFLIYFRNSFLYAFVPSVIGTLFAIMAGYVLSRSKFFGKNVLLFAFILTQMLPGFIGLAPKYQMLSKIGLVNSVPGIMLIYLSAVIPYSVITLRAFFDSIPLTIEEAAVIDGCSKIKTVFLIAVPLTLPGIASVFIFDFVNTWNELFNAILFLDSDNLKTIPVALNALIQKYDIPWGEMMAGTIIFIFPTIILFSLLRKYMIAGLTSGAVKG